MNRSVFPNDIDTFVEHYDIQASDVYDVRRFQELKMKTNLSPNEQSELQNLTIKLRDKLFTPEDFNKLQDCITNLEVFFRDNVQGFILQKQTEINTYIDNKKTEVDNYTDTAISNMEASKNSAITDMTTKKQQFEVFVDSKTNEVMTYTDNAIVEMADKKNYFTNYVNAKQDEIRTLVQDFDSNANRYYQKWTAVSGQTDFNIFDGSNLHVPSEASLNIPEEHIDIIINGVVQTPYVDYVILNNGLFDTIRLTANASALINDGTEVVAKWYKNVGKLYFSHASSHNEGGTDPLIVTEGMLDSLVLEKLNQINTKLTVGSTPPSSPRYLELWLDTNE